ncbi:acyl-CoA thioesterase [Kitasatospora sp. NBC_01250]|uniref:acyl-CoA thioesterase n=1 Tax=unclassified Kitasatospora TaxID=2633591 RepID=UPI002E1000B7|nr:MULTISPECIES: thioesterase family protein [unclassified Kitasatospora]WSJ67068.1 acyl-CoA thioesterase [Kitasatospora sp. NBC_01302]
MARHIYACPLRWSDMDAFGHVNNVVFLRYLEEARIDFMFTQATAAGAGEFAGGSVVARHEIDYKVPLVHRPEPVTIETWVTRIGGASLTVSYEVKDRAEDGTETVYVRASTIVVPYDLKAARPRRISPVEREFLSRFMDEPAEAKSRADQVAVAAA